MTRQLSLALGAARRRQRMSISLPAEIDRDLRCVATLTQSTPSSVARARIKSWPALRDAAVRALIALETSELADAAEVDRLEAALELAGAHYEDGIYWPSRRLKQTDTEASE